MKTPRKKLIGNMLFIHCAELKKYIPLYMLENNFTYELDLETMTYLPIAFSDELENYKIGEWGKSRFAYLKSNKRAYYRSMTATELWEHLLFRDKEANRLETMLMEQMSEQEGITPELKETNIQLWTGMRNNLLNRVHEIVYDDIIYN